LDNTIFVPRANPFTLLLSPPMDVISDVTVMVVPIFFASSSSVHAILEFASSFVTFASVMMSSKELVPGGTMPVYIPLTASAFFSEA